MQQRILQTIASAGAILFIATLSVLFVSHKPSIEAEQAQAKEPELSSYQKMLLELQQWERPDGPITVALQAGHWKNHEAPEEFPNLAQNTGAEAGGVREVDYNLEIAQRVKPLLEEMGMVVEILPATIPPGYYADLFVAIHADGSENKSKRGYKSSASRFDITGKGSLFSSIMDAAYGEATGLIKDPNVSNNMRFYYAFNWRRYEHSLHPMTVGIILETGFLSNAADRRFLVNNKDRSVQGIVNGIRGYIQQSDLHNLLQE